MIRGKEAQVCLEHGRRKLKALKCRDHARAEAFDRWIVRSLCHIHHYKPGRAELTLQVHTCLSHPQ
ncbi:hypothetical protein GCM10028784_20560 [Myceligenerans cantabricum]